MLTSLRFVVASGLCLVLVMAAGCSGSGEGGAGGGSGGGAGGGLGGGAAGPNDTGFRAMKDGLPFENYTNLGVSNLTADEMKRMFGEQVCASMVGSCTLTPAAQGFMDQVNKAMDGGHCFGFSHLALLFFSGKLKSSDFGPSAVSGLKKDAGTAAPSGPLASPGVVPVGAGAPVGSAPQSL